MMKGNLYLSVRFESCTALPSQMKIDVPRRSMARQSIHPKMALTGRLYRSCAFRRPCPAGESERVVRFTVSML